MSSVAVLTPESFAEHRSGLKDQEITGCVPEDEAYIPTYLEAFPPLPEKGAPGEKAGEPVSAWGSRIRPIKASVITQVFHVPLEERRYKDNSQFGEGEEAKVCLDIMQRTGAHIELSLAKDQGLSIMVTGKLDSVMKARKEIVARLQTQASATVAIPKEHHRFVIGKNGEKLQELELKTATKIAIPRPDDPSANIRITGTKEGIEKARHEILLISAEQVGHRLSLCFTLFLLSPVQAKSVMVVEVTAPAWLHRFIIGKKGQNIGRITQQLPRVRGEMIRNQRLNTKFFFLFFLFVKNGDMELKPSASLSVPSLLFSTLAAVNRIKEQYKVSVRIPQDSERSGLVRIEGDPKGVQLARRELIEMVQRMENERTKDLIVEQKFHRTIIGQKGEKIKEVRDKFPEVIINFPDPAQKSDIVQLRGPKNEVEKCAKFLQKIIADLIENSFSLSVPIFKQFHKNIIGKGGANIKKIREETNTKIDLPTENSNSEMIVITGKKSNCEAARDRILAIQRELANIKETEVTIPAKLHNSLIGSKGCLVRSIMEDCGGVHIHFPSEGSGSDKVTIRGPAGEVEKAKKQLLQLAEEKQVNNFTAELQAKPEYHKFLIGRGGANIRRVRDRTGARIIFPSPDDTEQELITIVGKEEAVRQAQKELESLVKNLVIPDSMVVDIRHHRHFVCRRGQVLRELAEEYGGVAVSFPRTGTNSQRVTLKGAKDCVEAAKKRIQEIIEDLESQVSVEVAIPQRYHRAIMGPKGCRIQHITREHEVQIKFPERDDGASVLTLTGQEAPPQENGEVSPDAEFVPRKCDIITISGRAEKCELAKAALLALVPITEDVEVSYELHRYIIGQKGSGIRKMMEEYEVNIWVPQPEKQLDVIKVTGLVANVERAKLGLLERVKELQAEQEDRALRSFKVTMSVDPKFHPKIIGRKGAVISQIRKDHDVSIQFPDKGDEQQDLIVISGYERNVEEARQAIQLLVAELQEMVSQEVHLDPRTHARIIGARGKAIRKLMEEFKVDIRFPQPGSDEPDKVTVMGLPETVDNAIDHLLNLEEEYVSSQCQYQTFCMCLFQAPDMSSAEDFPTFGTGVALKQTSVWGPKKF
uniref:High density lipoprotein-binding protein n=1 Tax=Sparus aurata TaxID=8175 RepID=A0A671VR46_SPAAU